LGSSDYRSRDAATKRLKELGEPAVDALVGAMTSNDLETCRRAEAILTEIGKPALDALNKAATSKDVETRRRAELIVAVIENKLYPELVLTGHANQVCCVCVSADGKRVLTSSADKTLRLWDADTGKCLRVFEDYTKVCFSPDGTRLLTSGLGAGGAIQIWDVKSGKELNQIKAGAWCAAFSADGKRIVSDGGGVAGANRDLVRLWDAESGKELRK